MLHLSTGFLHIIHLGVAEKAIEDWAKQGKRQANRTRKWNWPVQQRSTAAAWKNW
jgi:hypothetical protein